MITGRCYCGRITFRSDREPKTVAYCHCDDCRRALGAPVAAFAAFDEGDVDFVPGEGKRVVVNAGSSRSFCPDCGSSVVSRYDYLPGQVYVALGFLDQAERLPPRLHAHEAERLVWLHIDDDLDRHATSARLALTDHEARPDDCKRRN